MRNVAKDMGDFERGVISVGQLFPPTTPCSEYPAMDSAWRGVADSFRQAGDSLRLAINECLDVERESRPAV